MKKITLATIIISMFIGLVACNNSANNNTNKRITIEEAKKIALNHANLPNENVSFIRAEIDPEKGTEKYDIEFYYGNKEYDYEIDATNGQIIEFDEEVENYNIPSSGNTNNTSETQQPSNGSSNEQSNNATGNQSSNNAVTNQPTNNQTSTQQPNNPIQSQQITESASEITLDQAKEIALRHANLTANQVTFMKSEVDIDSGVKKYEIEFNYNGKEYSYEIGATTGNILSYEIDQD